MSILIEENDSCKKQINFKYRSEMGSQSKMQQMWSMDSYKN